MGCGAGGGSGGAGGGAWWEGHVPAAWTETFELPPSKDEIDSYFLK